MALQRPPQNLKEWIEDCQPVTWAAHGVLTLAFGFLAGIVASAFVGTYPAMYPVATSAAAVGYLIKEIIDFIKHWRAGNLRLRDWQGISRLLDGIVDAGAPVLAAASTWAYFAFTRLPLQ